MLARCTATNRVANDWVDQRAWSTSDARCLPENQVDGLSAVYPEFVNSSCTRALIEAADPSADRLAEDHPRAL
jgi:hypothetical protein